MARPHAKQGCHYGARPGQHAEKPRKTRRPIRGRTQDEVGPHDQLDIAGCAKRNQSDYVSTVGFLDEICWDHLDKGDAVLVGDE